MKCEIIKDLLPSYVDELTSNESNMEIEKHLESCTYCKKELDSMKEDISIEEIEINKTDIKPLKKLNKKVIKSVAITILIGITLVGSYFYLFVFGWRVNSNDLKVTYYTKDNTIHFNFELTNGRVLNAWSDVEDPYTILFTESFSSVLDDRGENPNKFSYGIQHKNKKGEFNKFKDEDVLKLKFKDEDVLKLKFKDKIEEINLNQISKELKLN